MKPTTAIIGDLLKIEKWSKPIAGVRDSCWEQYKKQGHGNTKFHLLYLKCDDYAFFLGKKEKSFRLNHNHYYKCLYSGQACWIIEDYLNDDLEISPLNETYEKIVLDLILEFPNEARRKDLREFFVGQVMKKTKGKYNLNLIESFVKLKIPV